MDTFAEVFCLSVLAFYSLILLALVVPPLIRYGRFNVLNPKQTNSTRTVKACLHEPPRPN